MINISPKKLNWILRAIPNFLWPAKVFMIKSSLKTSGKRLRLGPRCQLSDHRLIETGNNVFIGDGSIIITVVNVKIGNNVMFGPEVMIIPGDHNFTQIGKPMALVEAGGSNIPVIIEDDVWIGSRSTILKGVKIGEGSVIGAGSLVTKSILPYSVNAGHPINKTKCRFSYDELCTHLKLVGSSYTPEMVKEMYTEQGISIN